MVTLEERVAYLEGQVQQYPQMFLALREDIAQVSRRVDRIDDRVDRLDDKVSRQFIWLVGIQITSLIAMLGTLLAHG